MSGYDQQPANARGFPLETAPDGSSDAEYCVVALGRRPLHQAPGARAIARAASQTTAACGPDLTDLYITTAWIGLDAAARAEQPMAGGLFRVRPGTRGRKANRFGG
jgi:hypothetical protein